jgi:hypothetical protein
MSYNPLNISLSDIINENPLKFTFTSEQVEEYEIPQIDLGNSIEDIKQRLRFKLKTGYCSSVLIEQLAKHRLNLHEKFGNEFHHYHFPTILDTIRTIENGYENNVRPFKKPLLSGLKHIHHNSNTFIVQNMLGCWRKKFKGHNEITLQNKLLEGIYDELLKEYPEDIAQKKSLSVLLSKIQYESKFRIFKEQTGEWIVFAEKNCTNYYLCLATHQESKDFTDQVILDRLQDCFLEFPELKT